MVNMTVSSRLQEFYEYKLKSICGLLLQGKFGFLAGSFVKNIIDWNPYFWYRRKTGKDQFVIQSIRGHEMWIDLYDPGLSQHLFIRGAHEYKATEAYRNALLTLQENIDGDVTVLDVGGNIGYYVLEEVEALDDTDSIIVFEPDPQNRTLLERNIAHNGHTDHIKVSSKAVDSTSGEGTFHKSTHSNWNRLKQKNKATNTDQIVDSYSIETTSIDDYLIEQGIDSTEVGALRMDLEGHEINVLNGMIDVLQTKKPLVLFIEFHPDFVGEDEYESAISMIESYGFEIIFVNQNLEVLDIDSFDGLRSVRGSHVRVIFIR